MKIRNIIIASLAVTSFSALAFKSEPRAMVAISENQRTGIKATIFSSFNVSQAGVALVGSCSTSPVTGCGCAFCSMLRSQQN